jgi:hypothetical protein
MYSQGTGQLINPSKCSIYFGPVCDDDMKVQVMDTLQIVEQHFETKYLGLPTPNGRMTKGKFQSLQGKLAKIFMQVEENQMAQGGREVLIKAVGQSLATYVMGVYKLPFGPCDDLEKIIRNFWWGTEKGKRKMHWLAWDVMLKPKKQGGMGFKDMRMFNQALLARQAWRLIQFPDSLCAQILRAKYYPNGNLLDTVFTGNGSSTWHAIEYGLELLKKGAIWRIGNGANVRIWRDPWIPRNYQLTPISPKGRCRLKWVSELLNTDGTWNMQLLEQWFYPIDIEKIIQIKTSTRNADDFIA